MLLRLQVYELCACGAQLVHIANCSFFVEKTLRGFSTVCGSPGFPGDPLFSGAFFVSDAPNRLFPYYNLIICLVQNQGHALVPAGDPRQIRLGQGIAVAHYGHTARRRRRLKVEF